MKTMGWGQKFEKAYPYLWALATAVAIYRYGPRLNFQLNDALISTTTTITSILMGFLGTSYGILLSTASKRIEWAKGRQPIWSGILRFFNESFIANFVLCIYSIFLALLTQHSLSELINVLIFSSWAFLMVLSIVSFYRAMRILFGLLRTDS